MIARFAGISQESYANQFSDIGRIYWAAPIISGAYNAGILQYLEGESFEPKRKLTRAETVEMLYQTQFVQDLLKEELLDWDSY